MRENYKGVNICPKCNNDEIDCYCIPPQITCPICKRLVPDNCWEKHHLIPKTKKGKETVDVCVSCGDFIHKAIPINELNAHYNTIEKILTHEKIINWVKWISKKPSDFTVCMKAKKRR